VPPGATRIRFAEEVDALAVECRRQPIAQWVVPEQGMKGDLEPELAQIQRFARASLADGLVKPSRRDRVRYGSRQRLEIHERVERQATKNERSHPSKYSRGDGARVTADRIGTRISA
jgi:hypothetical protein